MNTAFLTTAAKSTKSSLTQEVKDTKKAAAKEYHHALFEHYRINDNDFQLKMAFKGRGGQWVIGIFPSEFNKDGFFVELTDGQMDPVELVGDKAVPAVNRKLFMLKHTPNYADVYELGNKGSYIVPISDMEELKPITIKKITQEINLEGINNTPTGQDDDHYSKMTIKDLVAILHLEPVSHRPWLNELLKKIKQDKEVEATL